MRTCCFGLNRLTFVLGAVTFFRVLEDCKAKETVGALTPRGDPNGDDKQRN